MKRNSVSTKEHTNIFDVKPAGITKHNLSSKIKEQKSSLNSKEKGAALKNALLEDGNRLTSSIKMLKNKESVSYRELVLNVLKKKNT